MNEMQKKKLRSELITLAELHLRNQLSDSQKDWSVKVPKTVLRQIETFNQDYMRRWAIKLRELADSI